MYNAASRWELFKNYGQKVIKKEKEKQKRRESERLMIDHAF